uniref:2-oxoacid dehydrogenase acyltransferase catalytic domain-containing protein n=1 Tax=Meloidogyne enterolobii TaxID=390850 RepID=A0A6V7XKF5_MELEN|nr:unnamed protein product [Meloidogyne enterolobii]
MIFVNPPIIRFPTFSRCVNLQHSPISSILIGPAVKLLLLKYNLNLENIKKRSGPKSNILKSDVLKYIFDTNLTPISLQQQNKLSTKDKLLKDKQKQQSFPQKEFIEKNSKINIIPHSYLSTNVSLSKIKKFSNQLKLFSSVDFPIESFVIYSCAQALKSVPEINVFWNENNYLQKSTNINISILDENKIPIIFNFADKIGLEIIAKLLKENKNLKEEMKRTFNIFNLSKLNISKFTSIITPPQTSILTIGSSNESLNLTLCYDARAIQEEDCCRFLNILNLNLAEPDLNLFLNDKINLGDNFEKEGEEEEEKNLKKFVNKDSNDIELDILTKLL